ncbi:ATP-binding protein [Rhizobium wuzhouense]|uniref:AAA+ ATPase domain-containing protein n=1 Tax=Rhizobium wuzhouense TaxID=1986026 RepID=A0ABX5NVP1_9HYPH|nr:ATP-binding protein [Rhizobium wuzhouense]PYB76956.1 hypothetical protein DMY87_00750 [Rhizobium wuzhouense]
MLDKTQTNPGIHKQFHFHKFSEDEQKILRNLSKHWYLTNSGETIKVAQSEYRYFLMKPTKQTSEMFNIEREIVCIFSDYANFEPRSLDIFDKIISNLPKMRTETVCEILISRAQDVEAKVDRLLKSDPEHPIVIPLEYKEMTLGSVNEIVLNRFRSHFYTRDLFAFLSPLKKDTYFFGRTNLINEMIGRYKSGEHTSLFGLRKSGKTSIVYAIERRLQSEGGKVLSLDCESPSVHLRRWYELLASVAESYAALNGLRISQSDRSRYDEKNAAESFERDMLSVFKRVKSRTLIILDEVERISPGTGSSPHWRTGVDFIYLWQTLRGFFQKHPGVFSYMLVGTNPSCVEAPTVGGHDNPIYASIPSQYVPSFTVDQVREMVSRLGDYMGLKFEPLLFGKLTEDFGGHPFLIRQVCSLINRIAGPVRPVLVDKALYLKAKSQFNDNSFDYLEMMVHVLREWYPDEYDMLRFLAQGDAKSFEEFAASHPSYTRHLIGYGLISGGDNGYVFNLESLASIIREKHKYERINLSPDAMVEEVSQRRNTLEKRLRMAAKTCLGIKCGKVEGLKKVLASVPQARRDKLENSSLASLLDSDNSPLFLLELIAVFRREWDAFSNVFDIEKEKFCVMLEEINKYGRPDAHAKHISSDDFIQMRLYFGKLDILLQDF